MEYFRLLSFLRPSRVLCNSASPLFSFYPPDFRQTWNPLLFFSFSSSSFSAALQNPNPNVSNSDLISEFLLRECGFAESRVAVLQKRHPLLWRRKISIEKARRIVDTFRNYGVSNSQIERILFHSPRELWSGNTESVQNTLKIMESFGFSKEDIADILSRCPYITHLKDLDSHLQSRLSTFGNAENVVKAVKRLPGILMSSPRRVETQIKCLRQAGFDDSTISSLIYRSPNILHLTPEKLVRNIKYLRDIGVSEDSRFFLTTLVCMNRGAGNFDQKKRILAKAGLSEEQIKEVFRKYPAILWKSLEKIQKVMDYLVSVAGVSPDVIVKYPKILVLSIVKRIKPRHEAFKYVSASGSFSKLKSLGRFIQMGEKEFREKFVEGNPDAHQLLKIYGSVSSANRKKLGQS
eukprot:TRINITY_DN24128_c0_g9_i1.p1 TRINITY_DN24128_c0_g9~~TRINITY_DN24128_c0_g9_i1.p1  ORF type:complete len:406 (+),score=40.08 TRINITY_DN24128_c0_g9_i1:71-1288(+)